MEKNAGLKFTFIGILVALWLLFFALSGINLGLDLKGGFELLYRLDVPDDVLPSSDLTNETIEVIQKRIDSVGLKEIRVQSSGSNHIIVSLPGGSEAEKEEIKAIVERMGVLWFALVAKQEVAGGDPYLFPKKDVEEVIKKEKEIDRENRKRLQESKPALVPEKMVVPYIRQVEGGETEAGEPVQSWKALFDTVAGTGMQASWGAGGGESIGTRLNSPWDIVFLDGKLYVAMAGSHQIWRYDPISDKVEVYAGSGREDIFDGDREAAALA